MKEFNLELAKAGHPVQTRDGRKVRIICWDVKRDIYPIIALVTEETGEESDFSYTLKGQYDISIANGELDLVMAPEKHEGWINLYRTSADGVATGGIIFKTKEDAENAEHSLPKVATIKIEWEE